MLMTFLRDSNGQFPEREEDDSVCVTVKGKNGEVMHMMLREGAWVKPPAPDHQKSETIEP